MLKNILLSTASLLVGQSLAGLYIVNPEELKKDFDNDAAEIKSKLSNIGYRGFQKGTSRIGQVIAPMVADGQGCEPFTWADDFTDIELTHFDKNQGFFMLLLRGGCSFG